ncbi:hypothetical protein NSS60_14715 [Anoxybacillus sp. FSL W8-0382]|uniref:hypothetical protein n=1 Tax=Anoxybacillus sp. FSL W8-0382 TaxID=2954700 RepID=UPI0030F95202
MDWEEVKRFAYAGQAFIPVNVENKGDSVKLFFRSGETKLLDVQSSLFLKRLLTFFGTSISINRIGMGSWWGKSSSFPSYCRMALPSFRLTFASRSADKAV